MEKIDRIVTLFDIAGEVVKIAPVGSGWINDTYRVSTAGDVPDYVLQRINHRVFQDVDLLQRNIERVTSHIRRKLTEAGREDAVFSARMPRLSSVDSIVLTCASVSPRYTST